MYSVFSYKLKNASELFGASNFSEAANYKNELLFLYCRDTLWRVSLRIKFGNYFLIPAASSSISVVTDFGLSIG